MFDSLYTQSQEHNECFRYNRYVNSIIIYIMKENVVFLQSGRHFMESFLWSTVLMYLVHVHGVQMVYPHIAT